MYTMNIIKFSYLKCFAVIVLIACATLVSAQQKTMTTGQMNINQLSDQQIIQIWQQAQKSGMSESEAISSLVKQG